MVERWIPFESFEEHQVLIEISITGNDSGSSPNMRGLAKIACASSSSPYTSTRSNNNNHNSSISSAYCSSSTCGVATITGTTINPMTTASTMNQLIHDQFGNYALQRVLDAARTSVFLFRRGVACG